MDELHERTASELRAGTAAGEFSAEEVVAAHLRRRDQLNPRLNAVVERFDEEALAQARSADAARARGDRLGPLHGVPVTVKTNIDVAGSARSQGVPALADAVPAQDAPQVARLRAAGAIIVGRTNMPDFGPRWHTDNDLYGATVNPWGDHLSPGGSSGGEVVAVATGMSALGLGTDSGGSLRVPAQWCGVASLKPSLGRVPDASVLPPEDHPLTMQLVNVTGPIARSVEDLETALRVLSGWHVRDPWSVPAPLDKREPHKVAVSSGSATGSVDPEVAETVHRAALWLEEAGYQVEEVELPDVQQTAKVWRDLQMTELSRTLLPVMRQISSKGAVRFIDLALETFPPVDFDAFLTAYTERARLAREWAAFSEEWPIVLSPVATMASMSTAADTSDAETVRDIFEAMRYVVLANGLGLPAAVVPTRVVDGVPHAVQLLGRRFGELDCLAAARVVEAASEDVAPPA